MTERREVPPARVEPLPGARSHCTTMDRPRLVISAELPGTAKPVTVIETSSYCTMLVDNGALKVIAIAVYDTTRETALMHTFTPEEARRVAEGLVSMSFQLDAEAKAEADQKLANLGFAAPTRTDRPGFNPQVPKGGAA